MESDIFSNCGGIFDLVFWNCPYVPRAAQLNRKPAAFANVVWDGGPDGTALIRRLIAEAPPFLTRGGKLLLGVNGFYVRTPTIKEIIRDSEFDIEKIVSSWLNPSKVFVLCVRGK